VWIGKARAGLVAATIAVTAILPAQPPDASDWQTAAGGSQTFEVASVKVARTLRLPNVPLNTGDAKPGGGRFSAAFPLLGYLIFAYKVPPYLAEATIVQLPKWATTDLFEIEARAANNPTKDQMRLMMQSLLAERFKLTMHFETRDGGVLALMPVRAGQTGPKLRPHAEGPPCGDFALPTSSSSQNLFPPTCGTDQSTQNAQGLRRIGYRNGTMERIAETIGGYAALAGEANKPVVDRTGLVGTYDFVMEYTPDANDQLNRSLRLNRENSATELEGTMFLTAMREQLGLKLVRATGAVRTLVIDHIERPSEN
jgi:uncharacterized protein (TIGR03435 family)